MDRYIGIDAHAISCTVEALTQAAKKKSTKLPGSQTAAASRRSQKTPAVKAA